MKVLVGKSWKQGVLDETLHCSTVRIEVRSWFRHRAVTGVFYERRASVHGLIGYFKKVGPRDVIRKVVSRLSERNRNSRFLSTGIGKVVSAGEESTFSQGDIVSFVAPNHPRAMSRIVLDDRLVRKTHLMSSNSYSDQDIEVENLGADMDYVEGWHRESGLPVNSQAVDRLCARALEIETVESEVPKPTGIEAISTRSKSSTSDDSDKPVASLFGYGNYAKGVLIPSVSHLFNVTHIHEIEPLQMGRSNTITWDTSPYFADDENPDVCFVAGYHHTHCETAIEAFRRGAKTLIEKPIVTTMEQLGQLRDAVELYKPQVYAGFNRRYLRFNQMVLEDLEIKPGDPVNYHCIVFEEPLPRYHWYKWPNSRTRLTSNGCHWIDHFLFFNGYPKIVKESIMRQSRGAFVIALEAENGAGFSMALTDEGSARVGVQEHIECRARGRSATIFNSMTYMSESEHRVIRRASMKAQDDRRDMYKAIGQKMINGDPGETESLFAASEICLRLEELMQKEMECEMPINVALT